jgi:hypothetical protein
MLGVRRTAESDKAKHMPIRDPGFRALKSLRELPRVKLLHQTSAGIHVEGIRRARLPFTPGPRAWPVDPREPARLRPRIGTHGPVTGPVAG